MRRRVWTSPDGQPVVPIRPLAYSREQLAVGSRLVEEAPRSEAPVREPEQVVHALGGLAEQRHVGVGAAAGDVVVAAVVPAHPLALVARGVGREVGLHADDRLDPARPWPWCRTRRRRTRCRGRSSRSRPCRARRCARTGRPAGPRRRAWSTRCGRGGGRRSRGTPCAIVVGRSSSVCSRCGSAADMLSVGARAEAWHVRGRIRQPTRPRGPSVAATRPTTGRHRRDSVSSRAPRRGSR